MSQLLRELERDRETLKMKLANVNAAINREKLSIAEREYDVTVGSVVKDGAGKRFKVIRVDARFSGKPWLEANPERKDGTFGTAKRNLYTDWIKDDWEATPANAD